MVPSANTVMEAEYHRLAPPGVAVHTSRFELTDMTPEGLAAMRKNLCYCAALLSQCSDLAVLGILSGTIDSDEVLQKTKQEIQTTYTSTIVTIADALLYVSRILKPAGVHLITPYGSAIAQSQASFLRRNGVPLKDFTALGYTSSIEASKISSENLYQLFLATSHDADLTFFTCTNVPTLDSVKNLYKEKKHLVVSSNLAGLWQSIETLGLNFQLTDFLEA